MIRSDSKHCYLLPLKNMLGHEIHTGSPRLMRISLLRISLLRFFKTFLKYLSYALLGLIISLLQFFHLPNAFLGLFISEIFLAKNSPKNALGKYLANANFSQAQKSNKARTTCRYLNKP